MNSNMICPCGQHRKIAQCCGRFLNGTEYAQTPEQLMRSRFTAYFFGGYGDYLLKTWLHAAELGLTGEELSRHSVNWQKLEILHSSQQCDQGEVEFKAYYLSDVKIPGIPGKKIKLTGSDHPSARILFMHERSLFRRIKGLWYYVKPV